jgi:hypothetical protein
VPQPVTYASGTMSRLSVRLPNEMTPFAGRFVLDNNDSFSIWTFFL